jgi:hypothetical protein
VKTSWRLAVASRWMARLGRAGFRVNCRSFARPDGLRVTFFLYSAWERDDENPCPKIRSWSTRICSAWKSVPPTLASQVWVTASVTGVEWRC